MMGLEGGLYGCDDPAYWRAVLNVYQDVVMAKGSKQGKTIALDKWYQEELPIAVSGRKDKHLAKEELVRLMEWKLSRGKFRPRLQQLVATNSSEVVESCTRKAFQLLPDVAAAMTELCKLKAVGPATASAILTSGAPEAAAFMADEAVESLPGLVPVQYTLKHYLLYLDGIQSCVKKLNEADAEQAWTPHRVEMCLWAWAIGSKLQLPSLQALGGEGAKAGDGAEAGRPKKKRKTT
ncbi:uncharacterized protein LOC118092966 isoform X1 [Zootoca vivipara]|uniref:uncharacterized protein LOC118092966 isoform X1 n=1 Tax=Zootoca vivipara TaxID=8524 RepID=UPI00293B9099|nr:uncharacterized protein LOC118092966 isoform X1 [Zootoca vivipara]XP_060138415.1 uncharacterized protein LOC118092966 isoform X1 [Zootoca vivipara]XP_060138416.1 uncharacterized protein LOC118092966 isoform X1 [Zootoca vivipara]